jgi:hypothetical protein
MQPLPPLSPVLVVFRLELSMYIDYIYKQQSRLFNGRSSSVTCLLLKPKFLALIDLARKRVPFV